MRIKRIKIQNFRSIKNLEFEPSNICALVGENNSGKTNILSALDFLLGEFWPSRRSVEKTDYFNGDTTNPIKIGIELDQIENPNNIRWIWCELPWEGNAETSCKYYGNEKPFKLSAEVRENCALVYMGANRDLEYHLGHSRWKLFGRIVNQLNDDFPKNSTPEKERILKESFDNALELMRTPLFNNFEETFRSFFVDQIKRTTHQIRLDFRTFTPRNYYLAIRPLLIEYGLEKDLIEAGQGMSNLILLSLFRTYAKVFKDDAFIAIEEPEIYLHPHARRSLYTLFTDLAEQGSQIFYSTHSEDFLDIEHFEHICLVKKCLDDEGELCTQVKTVSPIEMLESRQKLYPTFRMNVTGLRERFHHICETEHGEAFFANKIVLVEGATEQYVLPLFSKVLNYDFDAFGISVIKAGSKNNIDTLYCLYSKFEIPIYVIFDNDLHKTDQAAHDQNELLFRMLTDVEGVFEPSSEVSSHYAILEGNFERQLKSAIGEELYNELNQQALMVLGSKAGKPLIARFMARKLIEANIIPDFIEEIIDAIRFLGEAKADIPF